MANQHTKKKKTTTLQFALDRSKAQSAAYDKLTKQLCEMRNTLEKASKENAELHQINARQRDEVNILRAALSQKTGVEIPEGSTLDGIEITLRERPGRILTEMFSSSFPKMHKCDEKAKSVPHFTLLAQDNFAPVVIAEWIRLAKERGTTAEKIFEATALLKRIEEWRTAHPLLCKTPD